MLPKIAHHGNDSNRNSYHTITKDDAISETDENTLGTDNKFEESNDKLASLVFPTMNPAATVKQRIALLEGSAEQQNEFDRLTHDTFCNLSNNLSNTDQVLRGVIIDVQKAMDEKLAAFKKEYDHL